MWPSHPDSHIVSRKFQEKSRHISVVFFSSLTDEFMTQRSRQFLIKRPIYPQSAESMNARQPAFHSRLSLMDRRNPHQRMLAFHSSRLRCSCEVSLVNLLSSNRLGVLSSVSVGSDWVHFCFSASKCYTRTKNAQLCHFLGSFLIAMATTDR